MSRSLPALDAQISIIASMTIVRNYLSERGSHRKPLAILLLTTRQFAQHFSAVQRLPNKLIGAISQPIGLN
jgi:hypothetical protein